MAGGFARRNQGSPTPLNKTGTSYHLRDNDCFALSRSWPDAFRAAQRYINTQKPDSSFEQFANKVITLNAHTHATFHVLRRTNETNRTLFFARKLVSNQAFINAEKRGTCTAPVHERQEDNWLLPIVSDDLWVLFKGVSETKIIAASMRSIHCNSFVIERVLGRAPYELWTNIGLISKTCFYASFNENSAHYWLPDGKQTMGTRVYSSDAINCVPGLNPSSQERITLAQEDYALRRSTEFPVGIVHEQAIEHSGRRIPDGAVFNQPDYKDAAPAEVVEEGGKTFVEAMKCFLEVPVQGARASVSTGLIRHSFNHYVTSPLQMSITLAALATNEHAALVTPEITTYDCSLEVACLLAIGLDPRLSKHLRECSDMIIKNCPPWFLSITGQSEMALYAEGFGRIPKNENESFNLRAYVYQNILDVDIQVASSNQYDTITNIARGGDKPIVRLIRHPCKQAFRETGSDVLAHSIHKAMRQKGKVRIPAVAAITLIPSTRVTLLVFDGSPSPDLNKIIRRVPPFDIIVDLKFKGRLLRGMDIIKAYGHSNDEKINNSVSIFRNDQFLDGRYNPEITSFASSSDNSEHEEGECEEDSDQESAVGSTGSVATTTTFTSTNSHADRAEEVEKGRHKRKRDDSPPARITRGASKDASSRCGKCEACLSNASTVASGSTGSSDASSDNNGEENDVSADKMTTEIEGRALGIQSVEIRFPGLYKTIKPDLDNQEYFLLDLHGEEIFSFSPTNCKHCNELFTARRPAVVPPPYIYASPTPLGDVERCALALALYRELQGVATFCDLLPYTIQLLPSAAREATNRVISRLVETLKYDINRDSDFRLQSCLQVLQYIFVEFERETAALLSTNTTDWGCILRLMRRMRNRTLTRFSLTMEQIQTKIRPLALKYSDANIQVNKILHEALDSYKLTNRLGDLPYIGMTLTPTA